MSPYFLENQATDITSFRKFVAKFKKKRKIVYFRRISAFSSKNLIFSSLEIISLGHVSAAIYE